jgi:hypothetical protein
LGAVVRKVMAQSLSFSELEQGLESSKTDTPTIGLVNTGRQSNDSVTRDAVAYSTWSSSERIVVSLVNVYHRLFPYLGDLYQKISETVHSHLCG